MPLPRRLLKYSLDVISADGLDPAADVVLRGAPSASREALSARIAAHEPGYLLQRRLAPHPKIADAFGKPVAPERVRRHLQSVASRDEAARAADGGVA